MNDFCLELIHCVKELQQDQLAANGVLIEMKELATGMATGSVSVDDAFARLLDSLLGHPLLRHRFRRFLPIFDCGMRAGIPTPNGMGDLNDQFHKRSMIRNQTVSSNSRPTQDELATAILQVLQRSASQEESERKEDREAAR